MKRGAMHHTKMIDLCERLSVPRYVAVGILESLWHLTAREAPRGDIGRMTDERIAAGIDYPRKKIGELLDALVAAGWLDRCREHRLVIHDWAHHCDDSIKKTVGKSETGFAVAVLEDSGNFRKIPEASGKKPPALPCLALPEPSQSHAKPEPCAADAASVPLPEALTAAPFPDKWAEWLAYRRDKRKPVSPTAARKQLAALEPFGAAAAAATIDSSIANDWQGLFPEKVNAAGNRKHNDPDARREAKRAAEYDYAGELPVITFRGGDARTG